MARQVLTKTVLDRQGWPTGSVEVTWTAADAANYEEFALTGKEVVLAQNSGATPRTVSIDSKAFRGRTGDIVDEALPAGDTIVLGPFDPDGWAQEDGTLHLEASHAEVLFAVLVLP